MQYDNLKSVKKKKKRKKEEKKEKAKKKKELGAMTPMKILNIHWVIITEWDGVTFQFVGQSSKAGMGVVRGQGSRDI